MLKSIADIKDHVYDKHGAEHVEAQLAPAKCADSIAAISDDRWLAEATKCIFQAGFSWSLIDQKWPNFEAAFDRFDIHQCSLMSSDDLDRLLHADGIVRNAQKLASVSRNAAFFCDVKRQHGCVGAFFAGWRPEDYFHNLADLQSRTNRLGAKTGQIFLRRMGVESLILTNDVIKGLIWAGVVPKAPTGKRDQCRVQEVLNDWRAESGLTLSQISQFLALSV